MLDRLPKEILSLITERINDKDDLKNLTRVSRSLYQHTIRHLYRSVTIRAWEEALARPRLSILAKSAKHLKYVKDLRVEAPFHGRLRTRCPDSDIEDYGDIPDDYDDSMSDEDDDDMIYEDDDDMMDEDEDEDEGSVIDVSEDFSTSRDEDMGDLSNDDFESSVTIDGTGNENEYIMGHGEGHASDLGRSDQPTHTGVTNAHVNHTLAYTKHEAFLRTLESEIIPLFRCLKEGSLQCFSWNLGTCIPRFVVDYLSDKQTQITSLTITTDITCRHPDRSILLLGGFSQLRHISWTDYGGETVKTLSAILRLSSARLQEIEISYGSPMLHNSSDANEANDFVRDVLRIEPGLRAELFPRLQRLTLFGVFLENGAEDIAFAFRIPQLQFLKLQDCWGTNRLLDWLARSPQTTHLTSFELNFTGAFVEQHDQAPLTKFLCSFQGLEDLFILHPREWTLGPEYWNSVAHHHNTLRRFVHQQSDKFGDSRNDNGSDELVKALFGLEKIRFLGTCCQPRTLFTLLAELQPRPNLRFLHIRPRGWVEFELVANDSNYKHLTEYRQALPEVERFASWAFGPTGLPDLELLAYGDFSFRGRQPNVFLCRSQDDTENAGVPHARFAGYRYCQRENMDMRLWDLVQDNTEFLEACPEDYLFHPW